MPKQESHAPTSKTPAMAAPTRPTRARKLAALGGVLCIALALLSATPSPALEGEGITFVAEEQEPVEASYGPIPANDPVGLNHTPSRCPQSADCMQMPLRIIVPEGKDVFFEEYSILVTLTWDFLGSPDEDAVNDLDMYIYDMSQTPPVLATSAASASYPEVAKMFTPTNENYAILVSNFAGPNTGFRIKVEFRDASFTPPQESPMPARNRPASDQPPTARPESDDNFEAALPAARPSFDPVPAAPAAPSVDPELAPVPIGADPDFADGSFALPPAEAPETATFDSLVRARELGPVTAPSGIALLVWLGLLPLAAALAAGAVLLKRRPIALAMRFPVPGAAAEPGAA